MPQRVFRQGKVRTKIGGYQVQLQASMGNYMVYLNLTMMALMFWHTTASPLIEPYYPDAQFWMLGLLGLLTLTIVMLLDYKYMQPGRVAFLVQQSYKHANPAVRDLKQLLSDNEQIMEKLGLQRKEVK